MNIYTSPDRLAPYTISNYVTSPRTMSFQSWLGSPVMEIGDQNDIDYARTFENGDRYTHNDFILNFNDDLLDIIHSAGYNIEQEKQFKNEIAIFIYRLSREKL
uniref:Uncharacterized protein n=1 Tax=viral metagenome TaxID=1070528 RepID=A0A6C0EME7_9ZZZZ